MATVAKITMFDGGFFYTLGNIIIVFASAADYSQQILTMVNLDLSLFVSFARSMFLTSGSFIGL